MVIVDKLGAERSFFKIQINEQAGTFAALTYCRYGQGMTIPT